VGVEKKTSWGGVERTCRMEKVEKTGKKTWGQKGKATGREKLHNRSMRKYRGCQQKAQGACKGFGRLGRVKVGEKKRNSQRHSRNFYVGQ